MFEHHPVVRILGCAAERLSVPGLPRGSLSPPGCGWSLVRYPQLRLLPHPLPIPSGSSLHSLCTVNVPGALKSRVGGWEAKKVASSINQHQDRPEFDPQHPLK